MGIIFKIEQSFLKNKKTHAAMHVSTANVNIDILCKNIDPREAVHSKSPSDSKVYGITNDRYHIRKSWNK